MYVSETFIDIITGNEGNHSQPETIEEMEIVEKVAEFYLKLHTKTFKDDILDTIKAADIDRIPPKEVVQQILAYANSL